MTNRITPTPLTETTNPLNGAALSRMEMDKAMIMHVRERAERIAIALAGALVARGVKVTNPIASRRRSATLYRGRRGKYASGIGNMVLEVVASLNGVRVGMVLGFTEKGNDVSNRLRLASRGREIDKREPAKGFDVDALAAEFMALAVKLRDERDEARAAAQRRIRNERKRAAVTRLARIRGVKASASDDYAGGMDLVLRGVSAEDAVAIVALMAARKAATAAA